MHRLKSQQSTPNQRRLRRQENLSNLPHMDEDLVKWENGNLFFSDLSKHIKCFNHRRCLMSSYLYAVMFEPRGTNFRFTVTKCNMFTFVLTVDRDPGSFFLHDSKMWGEEKLGVNVHRLVVDGLWDHLGLLCHHEQKPENCPFSYLFNLTPKYFLPLQPYTDLVPPSTEPVPRHNETSFFPLAVIHYVPVTTCKD